MTTTNRQNRQDKDSILGSDSTYTPAPNTETESSTNTSLRSARIPFAIIITLTLLSGIVHGIIDGRWAKAEDLIAKGSQLSEIPDEFGDWTLVETRELDPKAAEMLRCYGSSVRVYRNVTREIEITVAILYGPRGPIAVHTPEVCYSSVGTEQVGERKVENIRHGSAKDQFWSVKFAEGGDSAPTMEVWYGWNDGNGWIASKNPRFWMVDSLYKLQIAGPPGFADFRPCKEFLTEFLPHANSRIQ